MHIEFDININPQLLAGAGIGAVGIVLGFLLANVFGLLMVAILAVAGKAGRLRKRDIAKIILFSLAGAGAGAGGVALGFAWWLVGLIPFGVGFAIGVAPMLYEHYSRRKRY